MWRDPGTWIALGVSLAVIIAGFVMHRVFLKILKTGFHAPSVSPAAQVQPPPTSPPLESHE